jgi:hypothetical protein
VNRGGGARAPARKTAASAAFPGAAGRFLAWGGRGGGGGASQQVSGARGGS